MFHIYRMKAVLIPTFSTTNLFSPSLFTPKSIIFSKLSKPISQNLIFRSPTVSMSSLRPSMPLNPKPHNYCNGNFEFKNPKADVASGEIHVIVGPMFAGKTTTLLRRMNAESVNGRNVAIIKSDKDTRYALNSIVTHDGEKLPCFPMADLLSFRQKLGPEAYNKLEVIGIDEAQFFGDLYDFCRKAADHDGKTVVVAGLDGDYMRRSFGSVLDIIPIADSVTKLTAHCELCGKRASFTLRKTEDTETELIAGAEVYMPVCRQHYVSGQVVKVTAREVIDSQNLQCSSFV